MDAAWRCDRCIYHCYRNKEHEQPGTCESGDADRDLQLIIAYVIELLGWFGVEKQPLTMRKVAGMAIAIIGVVIFEK